MIRASCPVCDRSVTWSGVGRPPTYCSVAHRRRAETLRAALPAMRERLAWWRRQAERYPHDRIFRYRQNADELAARIAHLEPAISP